jgi:HSP20 family molecular chaperone IbpA
MSFLNALIPTLGRTPAGPAAEATRRPIYSVEESEGAFRLTVNLPGVAKEGLEITAEDGILRILGKAGSRLPEGATLLHRESAAGAFELVLEHASNVDPEKIEGEVRDGVLVLNLAKADSAKPRKIAVS